MKGGGNRERRKNEKKLESLKIRKKKKLQRKENESFLFWGGLFCFFWGGLGFFNDKETNKSSDQNIILERKKILEISAGRRNGKKTEERMKKEVRGRGGIKAKGR